MTIEHIHKDVIQFVIDKYGKIKEEETITYPIDFDIEYTKLNPMCKDIVKPLKDENVFHIKFICPSEVYPYDILPKIFDLSSVKQISFKEYYLDIQGKYGASHKIFYNAIFNFESIEKWG